MTGVRPQRWSHASVTRPGPASDVVLLLVVIASLAGLALAPTSALAGAASPGPDAAPAAEASPGTDTTAPTTQVAGADDLWHNVPVTLTLTAADDPEGSGVAATYYALDGGPYVPYEAGAAVTVAAPADHTGDGVHTVSCYSVDVAGNAETPTTCTVKIDTAGPVTELTTAGGSAGIAFRFSYRISDALSPTATSVRLAVTDSHGRVVKRITWASRPAGTWLTARWKPLSQDTYTVTVRARDEAGNAQVSAATVTRFAKGPWWRTIGHSVQGRAVFATRFGSGPRRVLFVAGTHGNESGTAVARQFVSWLVSHPKAVPVGARIEVLRCLNPDGFVRHTRGNARRVDLNRNLPTRDWRSRLLPGSEPAGVYLTGGSSPGSEPETKALLALLRNGGFKAVVSLHSRGGILICEGPGSADLGRRMSRLCGLPLGRLSYEHLITGSLGTFVPERHGIPIVTVELRDAELTWGLRAAFIAVAR